LTSNGTALRDLARATGDDCRAHRRVPARGELLGPDRIIGLQATDSGHHWVLDLTGNAISWRPGDEPAAADLRGPVTDLLLGLYRRVPITSVEVTGDAGLVEFWLDRVGFG
jgi:hypothetical protein